MTTKSIKQPIGDMLISNSAKCSLFRNPPGKEFSRYVFYPGCQLSGLAPELVIKTYAELRAHLPDVGLFLQCCGTPAKWAGQAELFQGSLRNILIKWQKIGRPTFIPACSTCYNMFKTHLSEIPVISLWEALADFVLPAVRTETGLVLAIHDSCTTRQEKQIHDSVRDLLRKLGYSINELPHCREKTVCCGNRGLMAYTHPEAAVRLTQLRMADSALDFVTYCITCQRVFIDKGKKAYYLLDLLYPEEKGEPILRGALEAPQLLANRQGLKKKLLEEVWMET